MYPPSYVDGAPSNSFPQPQPPPQNMVPASGLSHPVGNSNHPYFGSQFEDKGLQPTPQASGTRESGTHNMGAFIHPPRLHEPVAGGSQHQFQVSGTPTPGAGVSNHHTSYLQEPAGASSYHASRLQESAGGSQHPGFIAPNTTYSQYPAGGYPTLVPQGPQLPFSTGRAFQQGVSSQFHRESDLAQNAPRGPTHFRTTSHSASVNPTTSQVYDHHNPQHAAGSYQTGAPNVPTSFNAAAHSNYQTVHSQDPAAVSYPNLRSQSQLSASHVFQQVAFNQLLYSSFDIANTPTTRICARRFPRVSATQTWC